MTRCASAATSRRCRPAVGNGSARCSRTRVRRAALASDVLGIGALATASAFVITLIATRPPREARVRARQGTRTLALHLEAGPSRLGLRGTF